MYHASNSRNLSLPTFLLISLHLDIIPKSTAIYLVVLIRLSSTSADKLLVKSHPHLADSINTHSRPFLLPTAILSVLVVPLRSAGQAKV